MAYAICIDCGVEFYVKPTRLERGVKYCSMDCRRRHAYTGRFVRSDGYVAVRRGDGFILEHRAIMEAHLGRSLETWEHVHHRNGVKSDNRLDNLEVLSVANHAKIHHKGIDRSCYHVATCNECGTAFHRRIKETEKHPRTYCSRKCFSRVCNPASVDNRIAHEPAVLARKPLSGTVADNVLTWGTGALNIDGCRVSVEDGDYKGIGGGLSLIHI